MPARRLVLSLGLLLVACGGADDGPVDPGSTTSVQLVGGQVVCDSCTFVRLVLSGPGIVGVREATLLTSDLTRTPLPARIVLNREAGASGEVLVVNAFFDMGVSEGDFDLWLDPPTVGDAARIVPAALRVTRARPGPGTMATLRVWVQVAGLDRDVQYTFRTVAGCEPTACAPMPVEPFSAISQTMAPGTYTFRLEDLAENCTLRGSPNPATLVLQRGITTALSYRLTCGLVANPGWVRVTNVTTGLDLDASYEVSCAGLDCRAFTLAANRDTVLRLAPGQLTVGFADVAPHCSLTSPATVPLTVSAGDTATAAFAVTCRELPSIRVTVRTSGRQIDEMVRVRLCDRSYYGTCQSQTVSSNGEVTFSEIQPGSYSVNLGEVAENCTAAEGGQSGFNVEVQGSSVSVDFALTCRSYATVRVSAVTTGTNQDLAYSVVHETGCDGWYYWCPVQPLPAQGSVEFRASPGTQTFSLTDVAPNCDVVVPGFRATVTAVEDGVVDLRFEVVCY